MVHGSEHDPHGIAVGEWDPAGFSSWTEIVLPHPCDKTWAKPEKGKKQGPPADGGSFGRTAVAHLAWKELFRKLYGV
jgi:hypothetical protein